MIGHTDKSVRDNPQRATIRDDIITVTNRYRRRKVFEYSLHIDEWYEAVGLQVILTTVGSNLLSKNL